MKQQKHNKPVVSVIVPVYNGTDFLEETVLSVLASTSMPMELILVNDGSTDKSAVMCRKFEKLDSRVKFFNFRKNAGMTRCLNFGISQAQGEFIARINQDDVMVKGRLDKQVAFMEAHPDHVVVGSYVTLFTHDNPEFDTFRFLLTDEEIKNGWMTLSPYADPSVMYRKSAYLKTNGYDQNMWPADDVHMWYQLGLVGKMANIPEVLTRVRWHEAAGSIRSHKKQMEKTWAVHQWAAVHVCKPTISEQLFWLAQRVAGMLFTPQFNWAVYRLMRKVWKRRLITLSLSRLWERVTYAVSWSE